VQVATNSRNRPTAQPQRKSQDPTREGNDAQRAIQEQIRREYIDKSTRNAARSEGDEILSEQVGSKDQRLRNKSSKKKRNGIPPECP